MTMCAIAVLLATSGARSLAAQGTLTLERDLRIAGSRHDLFRVGAMAVASDGAIAVTQWQDRALLFFDASGSLRGRVGRDGEGPGEFRLVNGLNWIGDTLAIYDSRLRRFTLVAPDLSVLRTVRVTPPARPAPADQHRFPEFLTVSPRALYADGSLQAFLGAGSGPAASAWVDSYSYFRVRSDGVIANAIARHASPDHLPYAYFHRFPDGSARGRLFPFVSQPQYHTSADGRTSVLITTSSTDEEATFRVTMFRHTGDTIYSRQYRVGGAPIPRAVADSAVAAVAASLRRGGPMVPWTDVELRVAASAWEDRAREHMPRVYPPIDGGVVIASNGSLWIPLRYTGQRRSHYVLDPAGDPLGTADLPRNVSVMVADAEHVWGLELDEFDIPSIVRYRLTAR